MTNTEVFPILHGGLVAPKKPEPAPNSDLALAIAAGKGDMEAFEKIYERHNLAAPSDSQSVLDALP